MKQTVYTSSWYPIKRALFSPRDPELGPVEGLSLVQEQKLMGRTMVILEFEDAEPAKKRLRSTAKKLAKSGGDPDDAEALIEFRNEL